MDCILQYSALLGNLSGLAGRHECALLRYPPWVPLFSVQLTSNVRERRGQAMSGLTGECQTHILAQTVSDRDGADGTTTGT